MICFWKNWIKYDLFLKKVESELYFIFKISYPNTPWVEKQRERGIRDLGIERVEVFGQKTNFIYSHKKGIGIPLLFEWNTYSSS
jgi:hypothetical protein